MGKRTEYAPGTFSYVELSTSDPGAAKSFYGGLFGLGLRGHGAPRGGRRRHLHHRNVQGDVAAAIFKGDGSLPPHWNNYVTVESAEDAKSKAEELGGQVMMGPMDVMGFGHMVAIADPTGGAFMAWEPARRASARRASTTLAASPGTSYTRPTSTPRSSSTRASSAGTPRRWTPRAARAT